ncbi:MAG TPA: flagellar biosynthesis anti-sigma factor FlgM [Pirellulales bacterium]|nr:flagellar biosynthesis anti-sigma factor FlgM [Pirellulales bacterium]
MQIYGPAQLHGPQTISAPHARVGGPTQVASPAQGPDEVHISDAARLVDQVNQLPDIRQDRVNAIRAQLAAGTYETADKLSTALDRVLNELA